MFWEIREHPKQDLYESLTANGQEINNVSGGGLTK